MMKHEDHRTHALQYDCRYEWKAPSSWIDNDVFYEGLDRRSLMMELGVDTSETLIYDTLGFDEGYDYEL
jgi:hypothetical protein